MYSGTMYIVGDIMSCNRFLGFGELIVSDRPYRSSLGSTVGTGFTITFEDAHESTKASSTGANFTDLLASCCVQF